LSKAIVGNSLLKVGKSLIDLKPKRDHN
jgi:hypothetical protein